MWRSIADSLSSLASTWYEHKEIVDKLNTFRKVMLRWPARFSLWRSVDDLGQELFGPLVARLGYEYPDDESVDIRQLRTKVIEQAADAGEETYVLRSCLRS